MSSKLFGGVFYTRIQFCFTEKILKERLSKILLSTFTMLISCSNYVNGQAPYIVTSEGIGKYGYIEKDASATYFKLNSNTYGNIYQLFARSYISTNLLTYGTAPNTCASVEHSTNNYNFGTLAAGNIIYSSVHADYCGGANSYSSNPNQTGFNERSFFVMDLVGKTDALVGSAEYSSVSSNVVLTFTISNNNTSGQNLNRLWIQNDGTSTEGTDIKNQAFRVYYEDATGSESFNGTESYGQLYGDYNSNPTNNNLYGNDALNIAIPQNSTGGLRCYVVLMGTSTYLNASAISKSVRLSIPSDGISITPNRNSSFSLMRIDETRPSNSYITITNTTLPVTFTSVSGSIQGSQSRILWNVAQEVDVDYYEVEESVNGRQFHPLTQVDALSRSSYHAADAVLHPGANYYRVKAVDIDGKLTYSKVIRLDNNASDQDVRIYPNPTRGELNMALSNLPADVYNIRVVNPAGQAVYRQWLTHDGGSRSLPLNLEKLPPGLYLVEIQGKLIKISKKISLDR